VNVSRFIFSFINFSPFYVNTCQDKVTCWIENIEKPTSEVIMTSPFRYKMRSSHSFP
jgi:hypothetical protein